MSIFLINGEMVEYTDDELLKVFLNKSREEIPENLIDKAIKSSIASAYSMHRPTYEYAKDLNEVANAAQLVSDTIIELVKYKLEKHIESIILEKLDLHRKESK